MTKEVFFVAGLSRDLFDRVAAQSSKRFVENGTLIARPLLGTYGEASAAPFIERARKYILKGHHLDRVTIAILYVDNGDPRIEGFLDEFFPFALPIAMDPFAPVPDGLDGKAIERHFDRQIKRLIGYIGEARRRLKMISSVTEATNMSPLMLPIRNFSDKRLIGLLRSLFHQAGGDGDLESFLSAQVKRFKSQVPMQKIDGDDRSCFSDGNLFFKTPGINRHGVYQYDADDLHSATCLLAAKSRIGGVLDPTFHFDCQPVKKRLKPFYPNCHGIPTRPKDHEHANIAPNDGQI